MRLGAVYPQIELSGDPGAVRAIGQAVEDIGYDHLLVYDHVLGAHPDRDAELTGPYRLEDPFHEPFVMFGHLAALTERLELVTAVLIVPQRQTVLVAKQAAEVAVLSGGRLRLGVGVGWNHVEYEALGQDFATRGAREEEQIDLLRALWSQESVSFDGRFDRVDRAGILPRPPEPIPIWLGGFSPVAFARAGRLADGFLYAGRSDDVIEALSITRAHAVDAGRDPDSLGAELMTRGGGDPDRWASRLEPWAAAGGTHASLVTMGGGLATVDDHIDLMARCYDAASHLQG